MHRLITTLLYVIVFTIPWEESVIIPYVGTLARLVAYVVLGLMPISLLFSPRIRPLRGVHISTGLFFLLAVVSALWTIDADATFDRLGIYARIFGLSWMIWEFTPTIQSQRRMMLAFIIGGVCSLGNQLLVHVGILSFRSAAAGERISGGGLNENDMACILVVSIVFAYHLATGGRTSRRWLRLCYWGYGAAAVFGVLLTGSRTGFILLGLCFIVLCLWTMRRNLVAAILLLTFIGGSLGVSFYWFLPEKIQQRLSTTGESLTGRVGGRREIWEAAVKAAEKSPIYGYGCGTFPIAIERGDPSMRGFPSHNSYIGVTVELGGIGLLLFLGTMALAFRDAWHLPQGERINWILLLGVMFLASTTGGLDANKTFWLVVALASSCSAAVAQFNVPPVSAAGRRPIPRRAFRG